MISCLPFDKKKKRIGQYWIWLSAFFSILQFPHFLSSFLENKEDDLGPVHVLIYRSSYGSTDCDALCQVSKHKLICNEQNYQINQPQNVAQSTKSFKKEIHNYLLKLAFDEKVCGYYGNLKVARCLKSRQSLQNYQTANFWPKLIEWFEKVATFLFSKVLDWKLQNCRSVSSFAPFNKSIKRYY